MVITTAQIRLTEFAARRSRLEMYTFFRSTKTIYLYHVSSFKAEMFYIAAVDFKSKQSEKREKYSYSKFF